MRSFSGRPPQRQSRSNQARPATASSPVLTPKRGPSASGLQRRIGNQAIGAAFAESRSSSPDPDRPSNLKEITVNSPSDQKEKEADRVANRIIESPDYKTRTNHQSPASPAALGASQAFRSHDRAFFSRQFNHDLSRVRIHSDTKSAEMAETLNANAFTVGHDIYFGAGQLRPGAPNSDHLLAHELTHVVQQSQTGLALQPKLKITGKAGDVSRALTLLNSGLFGHTVSVDKTGNLSISANKIAGPQTGPQQALADRLTTVINDPKDVIMTVSSGSNTIGGSYATGDFDIADLERYGVAGLIHEIEEQYQKQIKGLPFGSETTGAHAAAIKAESEVRGAKRGAQQVKSSKVNADGTLDAVLEIPHTFPDGTVKTMVMTVTSNNIVSVTWK